MHFYQLLFGVIDGFQQYKAVQKIYLSLNVENGRHILKRFKTFAHYQTWLRFLAENLQMYQCTLYKISLKRSQRLCSLSRLHTHPNTHTQHTHPHKREIIFCYPYTIGSKYEHIVIGELYIWMDEMLQPCFAKYTIDNEHQMVKIYVCNNVWCSLCLAKYLTGCFIFVIK